MFGQQSLLRALCSSLGTWARCQPEGVTTIATRTRYLAPPVRTSSLLVSRSLARVAVMGNCNKLMANHHGNAKQSPKSELHTIAKLLGKFAQALNTAVLADGRPASPALASIVYACWLRSEWADSRVAIGALQHAAVKPHVSLVITRVFTKLKNHT